MSLLFEWLQEGVERRTSGSGSGHAITFHDTYLSWRGLLHRVERRARELSLVGIREGDWVGLMLGNDPEFVVLTLALSKLDAVVVPIDPTTGGRDLDMIFAATPLRAIITRPNALDPLAAPSGTLRMERQAPLPRVSPESRHRLSGTLLTCSLYAWNPPILEPGQQPSVALFTSDAGGDSKAVLRTQGQLAGIANLLHEPLGLAAQSHVLCTAPLFDCQGFDFGLIAALAHGATLHLDDAAAGARLAKILFDHDIDLYAATPREFAFLTRLPNAKTLTGHPTQMVCSGTPLPETIAHAFHARFGIPLLACYHSCETGPISMDLDGLSPTTVGTPLPNVELRIADEEGLQLAQGATGRIWVRSPGVATTFLPTLPIHGTTIPIGRGVRDGWLRTGDVGNLDASGRLRLCQREDDIVHVDRRRVALGEIESCLESMDHVKAAQARVEYDDKGSTRIVVRITTGGRCRPEVMIDHCAKRLAPHKVPSHIELVGDTAGEPSESR